jgi:LysR family glycine cleavage system transcriptional activator
MAWRLPPMNALRVLEAAGRHMSFSQAAKELHVTPGAVSRQIKLLEEFLGTAVFERNTRALRVSEEGKAYIQVLSEAFERIDEATKRYLYSNRERPLHICCSMTFTLRWLVPRLPSFHAKHPVRGIRLTTASVPFTPYVGQDVDVFIGLGTGDWPQLVSQRLADSDLIPACSPTLLRKLGRRRIVTGLARQTLLHSLAVPHDWARWLTAAGASDIDPSRGLHFASSSLAYQAAIEGLGIAIAQRSMIQDDLRARRLVLPFDLSFRDGSGYYLICSEHAAQDAHVIEFRDWISRSPAPH